MSTWLFLQRLKWRRQYVHIGKVCDRVEHSRVERSEQGGGWMSEFKRKTRTYLLISQVQQQTVNVTAVHSHAAADSPLASSEQASDPAGHNGLAA